VDQAGEERRNIVTHDVPATKKTGSP